jgi:hypothetical protein
MILFFFSFEIAICVSPLFSSIRVLGLAVPEPRKSYFVISTPLFYQSLGVLSNGKARFFSGQKFIEDNINKAP